VEADGQCTDTGRFMAINRAFHLRLAEETGNPLLVEATDRVLDLMILSGLIVLYARGRAGIVVREHAEIVNAILARNPDAAYKAAQIHTTGVDRSEVIDLFSPDE
jgi:DNA-binding FadR family transcriptional regulator